MTDDLDVAARAFAAADDFERQASELRAELRRLRAAGRATPSWAQRVDARAGFSSAAPRIAVEAAFLIAAAVFVGVAGFGAVTVVAVMAAAWLVVCGVEWLAHRERRKAELLPEEPEPVADDREFLEALRPGAPARSRSSVAG